MTEPLVPAPPDLRPRYAPLSAPLWEHLVALTAPRIVTPPALHLDARQAAATLRQAHADALLAQLAVARATVDAQLPTHLHGGATARALATLGMGDPRRLRSRITTWRRAGIVRPAAPRTMLDRAMLSAVMVAWLLRGERERGWLPARIAAAVPAWWCWRQDAPAAPLVACPVPLPADLPAATHLWTPWGGAAQLDGWTALAEGSARWAGQPTLGTLEPWSVAAGVDLAAQTDPALAVLQALERTLP